MFNKDSSENLDLIFENINQWESRELGAEEDFVKKSSMPNKLKSQLNQKSNQKMQLISIRLPVDLINSLKEIGSQEGLGYQALSREVLQRFVDAENRRNINKLIAEHKTLEKVIESMRAEIQELKRA